MKKYMILFLLAAILMGCEEASQEKTTEKKDAVENVKQQATTNGNLPVYVLSDEFGEKFLLMANFGDETTPQTPDSLNNYKYILYNGIYHPVTFKGFQLENKEHNTSRETFQNFDNLSGWLYVMQSGKLIETPSDDLDAIWDAPLLVDETFKAENTIYTLSNFKDGRLVHSNLSEPLKAAFEKKYDRQILSSWCNAVFGENNEYQFVNIQFKNKGNEALGVSALVKNEEIIAVIEAPAEWNEESVWRVDDGGDFAGLSIDFVTSKNGVMTIYTANGGAEGTNYQSYVLEGNQFHEGPISGEFYQAPY